MADIEAFPPEGWAPHIVVRGRLTDSDLATLERYADTVTDRGLTVDIRELQELTNGGCETLRKLGQHLTGRRLRVLYPFKGPIANGLRQSGLLEDPLITWAGEP
jgi:hypothetical protein